MAIETRDALSVAEEYFAALGRHDTEAAAACWADHGVDVLAGIAELHGPREIRAYFDGLFGSFPDFAFEITNRVAQGAQCVIQWRATATFAGPLPFNGVEPTGAPISITGVDVLRAEGGRLVENHAFADGTTLARQIGLLPSPGSVQEQRLTKLHNARTAFGRRQTGAPERVADGVWRVRGGFPTKTMNVYFIEEPGGVVMFEAGIEAMTHGLRSVGAAMGGITRIVLGHAHADHRGAAPGMDAPVFVHEDDAADAEGDGGAHYFRFEELNPLGRRVFPFLLRHWDGGPVQVAGTLREGDEVAGFRVVHIPGHAPGMIALFRESDRLALTTDCFYTLDPQTGRFGAPRVPHQAFNQSTDQARDSIRKLAALEPSAAWPGHADPLTSDVRAQLEAIA